MRKNNTLIIKKDKAYRFATGIKKMKSNFLVEVIRGDIQEKRFYGWISVVNSKKKILKSLEIPDYVCFMRSCEKPIQALCAIEFGAVKKFGLDASDISISFASHSGSREHVEKIKSIMNKFGVSEEAFLCGAHPPFDNEERHRLLKEGQQPTVLHNNCSGKHLFMIASCIAKGWDYSNYTDFEHPIQLHITDLIRQYCQPEDMHYGIDGCGMPVHGMKLSEMGAGFSKFFDGTTTGAEIIADAVTEFPVLAGGKDRIDTCIIQASKGKLIAKVGAEGLIIVTPRHSGEALVVKASDGNNNVRDFVVVEALRKLGWLEKPPEDYEELVYFTQRDLYSLSNKKVGYYNFAFQI
jgi:L-asparaginase II